MAPIMVTLSDL